MFYISNKFMDTVYKYTDTICSSIFIHDPDRLESKIVEILLLN